MSPIYTDGMANSVDPNQTAPRGAVWSGSTLFVQPYLSKNLGTLQYFLDSLYVHFSYSGWNGSEVIQSTHRVHYQISGRVKLQWYWWSKMDGSSRIPSSMTYVKPQTLSLSLLPSSEFFKYKDKRGGAKVKPWYNQSLYPPQIQMEKKWTNKKR